MAYVIRATIPEQPPKANLSSTIPEGTPRASLRASVPGTGACEWNEIDGKPFTTIGDNLKVVCGALTVDTANDVEQDNTRPITSAAVYVEVGNINALLALI